MVQVAPEEHSAQSERASEQSWQSPEAFRKYATSQSVHAAAEAHVMHPAFAREHWAQVEAGVK